MAEYNPWAELEDAAPTKLEAKGKETSYNPWQGLETVEESKDPMAWKAIEKMTAGERTEYEFAGKHPNLYGLLKTSLDFLPYTKYVSPEEQQNFAQLSQQEQTRTLLMDALSAALWGKIGPIGKASKLLKFGVAQKGILSDIGYAAKGIAYPMRVLGKKLAEGGLPKGFELLRVEDALRRVAILSPKSDFQGFDYTKSLWKTLKKQGFRKEERELLTDSLKRGDGAFSTMDNFQISELTRRGYKFSEAFQKNVPLLSGKSILRSLDSDFVTLHSEMILDAQFRKATFENVLKEIYGKPLKDLHADFSLRLFQERADKLYPQIGKNFNFGEATTAQMANISRSLLEDPLLATKTIMPGRGYFTLPTFLPVRVVMGIGQKLFQTYDKVYKVMTTGLGRANRNSFNHTLLWAKLLEQEGLYTEVKIDALGKFMPKKAKFFTPEVVRRADAVITKMSNLTVQAGATTDKKVIRALLEEARALPAKSFIHNDPAMLLYNAYRVYSDHLYSDYFKAHFTRTLADVVKKNVLPSDIIKTLRGQSKYLEYEIDNLFSTVAHATPGWKIGSAKRLLGRAQRTILRGAKDLTKEQLAERGALTKLFDYGTENGFPAYLENYTNRLRVSQAKMVAKWRTSLYEGRMAGFRKPIKLRTPIEKPVDFATRLERRTMAQARDVYLYKEIDAIVEHAKRLPPAYKDLVDTYISGVLGLPTATDHNVAWFLTRTIGAVARVPARLKDLPVGQAGQWDEWRVLQLANDINTLTYLGALGFKPFSAVRNLFQTLLNVPADLGGMKDLGTLVSGAKKAFDPAIRKYLVDIGAITEFAPEIHLRPPMLPFGKKMIGGYTLPSLRRVQDVGLWMFKGSDRWNRYMTGGAALRKWEKAIEAVGGKAHVGNIDQFVKHLNIVGRRKYAQEQIIGSLMKGDTKTAMKDFVLDVIADTQYLYGVAEAPLIMRKYGAVSKTGTIFQSWWMNYGTNIEKWMRTGESVGAKTDRMITAMTSAAIAYELMSTMWGKKFAAGSVGFGPFPGEMNEFIIPPAWKPIYHSLMTIANIQTPEVSARHAKNIFRSSGIFVPGYLQMKQTYQMTKKDAFEGFSKSILRIKQD